MKEKTSLLFLSIILILAACQPQATSPSSLSATLSEATGSVNLKHIDEKTFSPISIGSTLEVNEQLQTGSDGRVRLDLSTGTLIRVAPSSLFTLTANSAVEGGLTTKIKLELGKVFIILNGGVASVETPSGIASVSGSYMKVEVDPVTLDVYVTCLEGHCSASNPAGGVNFTKGERTILFQKNPSTGKWTIPNVEPMSPDEFQEWLDENPEARELFDQAVATMTALAKPSITPTPTIVPATVASKTCFNIIQPVAGSILSYQGKVKFEWETQPTAKKYIVSFTTSNGGIINFETTETNLEKFVEGFIPSPGDYKWTVTAFGEDGSAICSTDAETFSKPDSFPKPPEKERVPVCDPCDYYGGCWDPYAYCPIG